MTIWFGRPGAQIELPHPRGGVTTTRDRPAAVFRTGTGGARVGQAVGAKRQIQLNWQRLWYETYAAFEGFFHGHEGPGPFSLHDPGRVNWLTVNQSSATSQTSDVDGFGHWNSIGLSMAASGDYAFAPDGTHLQVTGDIELAVDVALDTYDEATDNQCLIARWSDIETTERSIIFYLTSTGLLRITWSTDGSNSTTMSTTSAVPFAAGDRVSIRVVFDVNDGSGNRVASFYYSTDPLSEDTEWTLFEVVTSSGTTSIFAGSLPLTVGAHSDGVHDQCFGTIYSAWVKDSGGVVVAHPRFDQIETPNMVGIWSHFADDQGNMWFIGGNAEITGAYDATRALDSGSTEIRRGPRSLEWGLSRDNVLTPLAMLAGSIETGQLQLSPAAPDTWPGIPVVPDQPLCFSFYAYAPDTTTPAQLSLTPRLVWLDEEGSELSEDDGATVTGTELVDDWVRLSVTATPPDGAAFVLLRVISADGPEILVSDTFDRTVAAPDWGTPDVGPEWTTIDSDGGDPSVSGGQGHIVLDTANQLSVVGYANSDIDESDIWLHIGSINISATPSGGVVASTILVRMGDGFLPYISAGVDFATDGTALAFVNYRESAMVGETAGPSVAIPGITASEAVEVLIRVHTDDEGTHWFAMWAAPASSGLDLADAPLISIQHLVDQPGAIALGAFGVSGTVLPRTISYDDVRLGRIGEDTNIYLDQFQLEFGSEPTDWRPGTGIYPVVPIGLTEQWPWQAADYREQVRLVLQETGSGL